MTTLTPLLTAITVQMVEAYEDELESNYWQEDTRATEQRKWDLQDAQDWGDEAKASGLGSPFEETYEGLDDLPF